MSIAVIWLLSAVFFLVFFRGASAGEKPQTTEREIQA